MSIIIAASIISVICATIIAVIVRTDSVTATAPVEDAAPTHGTTSIAGNASIAGSVAMVWAREAADRGDIKQAEVYREMAVRMGAEPTYYTFWGDRI